MYNQHGKPPFRVAVIHGGPGAAGEVEPVAQELSKTCGILEPLQTADSISGQVRELQAVLVTHGQLPMTLIGHSWGAWLSTILAAECPNLVKKLILVGSGPFEDNYAKTIMQQRLDRLTDEKRSIVQKLLDDCNNPHFTQKDAALAHLGTLLSESETFDQLDQPTPPLECQYSIYQSVWSEAAKLRSSGRLLKLAKQVQCPVVAIHGIYDPHPAEGVREPLSRMLKDFRFILLESCGHKPWFERLAKDKFYSILREELE